MSPVHEFDRVLLSYIRESIRLGEGTIGRDPTLFYDSAWNQRAAIQCIETLADAAGRLSQSLKDTEQSIPWKQIAGMPDVLAHGHIGIDLGKTWATIEKDLPVPREAIDRMIERNR